MGATTDTPAKRQDLNRFREAARPLERQGSESISRGGAAPGTASGAAASNDGGGGNGDAGGGPSSGGASLSCDSTDPGFCACSANGGASNDGTCSPSTLAEPGACCAPAGYPSAGGTCTCASFTCDVNAGGGRDCWYHAGDANHTTSATGAVCCLRLQGICSCYAADNADSCQGFTTVSSCTAAVLAPCTDIVDEGEVVVPTCR